MLTLDEVCWIIANSADKNVNFGSYPFDNDGHSIAFGYGRIDASAALELLASGYLDSINCSTNTLPKFYPQKDFGTPTNYYFYNNDRRIYLKLRDFSDDPMRNHPSLKHALKNKNALPVSYADSSEIIYLTDHITLAFQEKLEKQKRLEFFDRYKIDEIRELPVPNSWLVKVKSSIPTDSLFISVEMYNDSIIQFAEPDLVRKMEKR
jgi:hypothetical protein